MKKRLILFIFILVLITITKYNIGSYKLNYKVNNHDIVSTYNKGIISFNIDNKYTFDIYKSSAFNKIKINKIIDIKSDNIECIYPLIDNIKTYPLCYEDNIFKDYNLIDNEILNEYKEVSINDKITSTFEYYNNASSYIALWNYKGYYILNKDKKENVELFENDSYENHLSFIIEDNIYTPNYDEKYTFSKYLITNIKTHKTTTMILNYNIDYDSYIVGTINDKVYLFDNKNSILYEIDTNNESINIKGSTSKGFVKYVNGKEEICSKSEYKINKITIDKVNNSKYKYFNNNGLYKKINEYNELIINKDIDIIYEYKDSIYYIDSSYLYEYTPYKTNTILYYNEFGFNDINVFIYND